MRSADSGGAVLARRLLVLAVLIGGVVGVSVLALYAFNPVADEWVCAEGQAPATNAQGGGECFPEGSDLPAGYTWEPWGNRPMPYNCDKDGWTQIQHRTSGEHDCVRDGTDLPSAWEPVPSE